MCPSPKKLKSLIGFPYILDVKVHVLSFNMILISSPQGVPTPSYPFRGNLGDQVKDRSTKNLNLLIEVPYVSNLKVQVQIFNMNEPFLFSVACSQTQLSISGKIWEIRENVVHQKNLKSLIKVTKVAHLKEQVESFNVNLIFSPQRVPRQIYQFQ